MMRDAAAPWFPWVDDSLDLDEIEELQDVLTETAEHLIDTATAGPHEALLARECAERMAETHGPAHVLRAADQLSYQDALKASGTNPFNFLSAHADALASTRAWA